MPLEVCGYGKYQIGILQDKWAQADLHKYQLFTWVEHGISL